MIAPGATIGILGDGQLGRMLALAAARLGLSTHIYAPGAGVATEVARAATQGAWDDGARLELFARDCAVVTYEFENVPLETLDLLAPHVPVLPGRASLEASQDRLREKNFLTRLGVPVAEYAAVEAVEDLPTAIGVTGLPAILKTRREGYDGRGQIRIEHEADAEAAWTSIGAPAVLEAVVPFEAELSVIAVCGDSVELYDPGLNVHEAGVLRTTTVPSGLPPETLDAARDIARRIAEALDHRGVLAVELFAGPRGLVVNELAPRVHNSGHWTELAATDQFEAHIRAIAGWPAADLSALAPVRMENILGQEAEDWARLAAEPGARLHLYGKSLRPGRKMGHVVRRLPHGQA